MILKLRSFSQLVQDMGATLQGSAVALIDISVGSVTRALLEANAAIALWIQWLVLQVLQTTRAATSTGADLDTWMADFGLARLPAVPASGSVTFFRFATNLPASIPPGVQVKTGDGSKTFSVVSSSAVSIWDEAANAYVLPVGIGSATIPVICNQAGQIGNVIAGTISIIASSLPGVDQVINPSAFTDGRDAETDDLFRSRFVLFLAGLSRATPAAIRSAIAGVQQGLNICLLENKTSDGTPSPGSFVIIADDGSGTPSSTLLSEIANAVDNARPVGSSFAVIAPNVTNVTVSLTVTLAESDPAFASAIATLQQSVQVYLDTLPISQNAAVSKVIQAVYAAIPTISNVSNITLNGQQSDVNVGATSVVKSGAVSVTMNGY